MERSSPESTFETVDRKERKPPPNHDGFLPLSALLSLSLSLSLLKRAWRSREREIERREEETKLVRTLARVVASSRVEVRGKKEFCERESRETVTPSRVFMLALSLSRLDNQAKNFSARKKKRSIDVPAFSFSFQHTMLRAPQVTVRAGSAALASCSSSSSARPALPPRSSGGVQRRRSASSPLIARAGNATEEASKAAEIGVDDCADNIGDFCTIDKAVGGWRERQREKERRRRERERRRRLSRASRRGGKGHHFCVLSGSPRRFFLFESKERVVVLAYE